MHYFSCTTPVCWHSDIWLDQNSFLLWLLNALGIRCNDQKVKAFIDWIMDLFFINKKKDMR